MPFPFRIYMEFIFDKFQVASEEAVVSELHQEMLQIASNLQTKYGTAFRGGRLELDSHSWKVSERCAEICQVLRIDIPPCETCAHRVDCLLYRAHQVDCLVR
jgi:hypothetical protein